MDRCGGVVVSIPDFQSDGQKIGRCLSGSEVRMVSVLPYRQETLLYIVSLHPGVQMGTGNILLGVPCDALASHSDGSSNYSCCFILQKPG